MKSLLPKKLVFEVQVNCSGQHAHNRCPYPDDRNIQELKWVRHDQYHTKSESPWGRHPEMGTWHILSDVTFGQHLIQKGNQVAFIPELLLRLTKHCSIF